MKELNVANYPWAIGVVVGMFLSVKDTAYLIPTIICMVINLIIGYYIRSEYEKEGD